MANTYPTPQQLAARTGHPRYETDALLTTAQLTTFYENFTNGLGIQNISANTRHDFYRALITRIMDGGGADTVNIPNRIATYNTVSSVNTLRSAYNLAKNSVPGFTNARFLASVADLAYAILDSRGTGTRWAEKHGGIFQNFRHSFPGAEYLDPKPSPDDRAALEAVRQTAINAAQTARINAGIAGARALITASAEASTRSNNPLLITQ